MEELKISLAAARVNAKLNQREAAIAIGVDPATVSNWERGLTEPTIAQAQKIAEVYKWPLDRISFRIENPL